MAKQAVIQQVAIPKSLWKRIKAFGKKDARSGTWVVIKACEEYLEANK